MKDKRNPLQNLEIHCIQCGELLRPGRPDRKFCSARCKNRWHNARVGYLNNFRLRTLNALDRNHRILQHLSKLGLDAFPRSELLSLGFQPEFFTSCTKMHGHLEYACFDMGYRLSITRLWGLHSIVPYWQEG